MTKERDDAIFWAVCMHAFGSAYRKVGKWKVEGCSNAQILKNATH